MHLFGTAALVLVALIIFPGLAALPAQAGTDGATQFIPLSEVLNGPQDNASNAYVTERCAALYGVLGHNYADDTEHPQLQQMGGVFLKRAEFLIDLAFDFNSVGMTPKKSAKSYVDTTKYILDLGKIYADRIYQARLRSANAFNDPLLASDWSICNHQWR